MFRASSFHLQEALHSGFWCELRALLAVGWLQVFGPQLATSQPLQTEKLDTTYKFIAA
jgi:hypothetical protein